MTKSQTALSAAFIVMGVLHFVVPKPFVRIMPRIIPREWHRLLVFVSGAFELAGGIGVILPALRPFAGAGLILLLIAVFPANVQMLVNARETKAPPASVAALWARLPLQAILMWWVWVATRG